jgi:hypothetical protein
MNGKCGNEMRKLIIFFILMISLLIVGCKANTQTTIIQLDSPKNVVFDGVIKWNPVENAQGYEITINGSIYPCSDIFYVIESEGVYTISVVAKGLGYLNSESSEVLNVTINYENEMVFDFQMDELNLSWTLATDAVSYNLFINGIKYEVTGNNYSLSAIEPGLLRIAVQAVYPIGLSNVSSIYTYLHNLSIEEPLQFQYSINSTIDIIIWEPLSGPLYIMDYSGDFIDTDSVLDFDNETLTILSSFIKTQGISIENQPFQFYIVSNHSKTLVEVTITDKIKPYIISSSLINTNGEEDILLQFELFNGTFFSINGAKNDVVLYETNANILTINAEFINQKFVGNSSFVLSYVINFNDDSVIGYLYFSLN